MVDNRSAKFRSTVSVRLASLAQRAALNDQRNSGPVDPSRSELARASSGGAMLRLPPDVGNFFFADSFLVPHRALPDLQRMKLCYPAAAAPCWLVSC